MPQVQQRFHVRNSTGALAMQSMTTHQFMPGVGYKEFSQQMNEPRPRAAGLPRHCLVRGTLNGNCKPSAEARAGSHWYLKPPGGAQPIVCAYVPTEQAWMPVTRDGKRMAFKISYLESHGWNLLQAVA